jgi:signal transduction histidine kinase
MLAVFSAALLAAVGTYGYLAASTFTADKLAYIYDLNATMVASLTEQTRASLNVLTKAINIFADEALRPGSNHRVRTAAARDLFAIEQDMLRVAIYRRSEGSFRPIENPWLNRAVLESTEMTTEDLERAHKNHPVPFDAIASQPGALYVQNSSEPPSAALLSVAFKNPAGGEIIVADLKHERLLRIFGESKLQLTYLVDDRGQVVAHPDPDLVLARRDLSGNPLVKEALGTDVAKGVKEFVGEDGEPQLGAFGEVGAGRLWVLTQIPRAEALRASRELIRRTALFAIAVLLGAFIASIFFSRVLTSPIRRLRAATERVGQGQLDVQTHVRTRDEIGELARAFEQMAAALKETQGQLIQSEKMAAFGQLGAGITHEVKNPMTGIISFAQLAQRKLDDREKLAEFLELIEKEALRCRDILVNFLKFARASSRDPEPVDVNVMVDTAANMARHQLSIHNIRLKVSLADDVPHILGNGPELQQVLLNLAINAQQAMVSGGSVAMSTDRAADGSAVIRVADTGPGIPPDIQAKIFEPFYTTKEPGEGTGLGLSVSFGIVKGHQGTLQIESTPGEGATFVITLPAAPAESSGTAESARADHPER